MISLSVAHLSGLGVLGLLPFITKVRYSTLYSWAPVVFHKCATHSKFSVAIIKSFPHEAKTQYLIMLKMVKLTCLVCLPDLVSLSQWEQVSLQYYYYFYYYYTPIIRARLAGPARLRNKYGRHFVSYMPCWPPSGIIFMWLYA